MKAKINPIINMELRRPPSLWSRSILEKTSLMDFGGIVADRQMFQTPLQGAL